MGGGPLSELVSKLKEKSELRDREDELDLGHFEDPDEQLLEAMSSSSENGSRASQRLDSPKQQQVSPKIQILLELPAGDEEEGELRKRDEKPLHDSPFNDEELDFLPVKKTSD